MQPQPVGQSSQADLDQATRIKLVSHSMLFYWWPVWVFGLLFGCLSWLGGSRLAIVPEGTRLRRGAKLERTNLRADRSQGSHRPAARGGESEGRRGVRHPGQFGQEFWHPLLHRAPRGHLQHHIPLRGLWSVIVLLSVVLLALVFAFLGWWQSIFTAFASLHIYISAAGYLFPAIALLLLWLITVFLFDPSAM